MLKYLEDEMNKMINKQTNHHRIFYNLVNDIIQITNDHFNITHNFNHPVAYVSWKCGEYEIWLLGKLTVDDLTDDSYFLSISIFKGTHISECGYAQIKKDNNKIVVIGNLDKSAEDSTLIEYDSKIKEMINNFDINK